LALGPKSSATPTGPPDASPAEAPSDAPIEATAVHAETPVSALLSLPPSVALFEPLLLLQPETANTVETATEATTETATSPAILRAMLIPVRIGRRARKLNRPAEPPPRSAQACPPPTEEAEAAAGRP
jgi:hypothetical protein